MFIVYVITSKEGYHYTGFTNNIPKRLDHHNSGLSKWTKRGSDWKLVYSEQFDNESDALKREILSSLTKLLNCSKKYSFGKGVKLCLLTASS